jgi:hypothetical protein
MKKSLMVPYILLATIFFLSSILIGCGEEVDMTTQISGLWKRTQSEGTVELNLAANPKTVKLDGHTYNVVVEKIDKGMNTIEVKVEMEDGKTEVWSIHQMWNDNGSSFKLSFRHNGTHETLEHAGQS